MREITLAATRMVCSRDIERNMERAEKLILQCAEGGARLILIQKLFETPYFCIEQSYQHLNPAI